MDRKQVILQRMNMIEWVMRHALDRPNPPRSTGMDVFAHVYGDSAHIVSEGRNQLSATPLDS